MDNESERARKNAKQRERYHANLEENQRRCREKSKARRAANPELARQKQREWRARDPERYNAYAREWQKKNLRGDRKRSAHYKFRYGLSLQQIADPLEKQGGGCAICGELKPRMAVDRCHKSGAVRGILCGTCNSAIGMLQENPQTLAAATKYLEEANDTGACKQET